MTNHSANELQFITDILGPDGATVRATGVYAGLTALSGRRLEQAQLTASETSHVFVYRYGDASTLDSSCYIVCDGVTYIVDHAPIDPHKPRPNMWLEVLCHVINDGTAESTTPVSPAQTFKSYVNQQDAATLAAAEAYTDARSGPQVQKIVLSYTITQADIDAATAAPNGFVYKPVVLSWPSQFADTNYAVSGSYILPTADDLENNVYSTANFTDQTVSSVTTYVLYYSTLPVGTVIKITAIGVR